MKQNEYKEAFLSRTIFLGRHIYFSMIKIIKKLKKIWKQRKEYLSKEYWNTKSKAVFDKEDSPGTKENKEESQKFDSKCYNIEKLSQKLAVYTCIFGAYDLIREPLCKSKWCDYYIITDQLIPEHSVWKKIEPAKPEGFSEWPNAIKNRYFKMHPEKVFSEYRYSMYVDGNVWLLADMYPFLMQMKDKFIGIFKYPLNDCFYINAPFLESLGLVPKELSNKQVETYRKEGFPEHFGYFECGVLLREHNHPQCVKLMDIWWEQYCTWVKRDQQCLMYSLWKNGLNKDDVACLGDNLRKTERFVVLEHKQKHALVTGGPDLGKVVE